MIYIYIAAPYTKPDPVENTHKVIHVANHLVQMGFIPIVPHLSMLWHAITPKPYEFWLRYDLALLVKCDAVLRLSGESPGADAEVKEAIAMKKHIFYSLQEVVLWQQKEERYRQLC